MDEIEEEQVVAKKRGRPPKKPVAGPPTQDEAVKDIVKKKRAANFPQLIENKVASSDVQKWLNSVLRWYGRELVKSDDECAERLQEFFQVLSETGELPSVEKMALALGTTRMSLWNWENGIQCSPRRQHMIKQAKEMLAAMDADLVSNNKIPQVTYIFRAKNFFGMKDQTDVVITPNNPVGAEVPEEELRKRIAGDVVIDKDAIEADYHE